MTFLDSSFFAAIILMSVSLFLSRYCYSYKRTHKHKMLFVAVQQQPQQSILARIVRLMYFVSVALAAMCICMRALYCRSESE